MTFSKYTSEMITFIETMRVEGKTWKETRNLFNAYFKTEVTISALRHVYRDHCDDSQDKKIHDNKLLNSTFRSRVAAREARRQMKSVQQAALTQEQFLDELKKIVIDKTPRVKSKSNISKRKRSKSLVPMTVELLLSDVQIGKKMICYNSDIARKRLRAYAKSAIFKIKQHQNSGYNVERIVLSFLGDIIESSEKHKNSQRATDCSTPEQVRKAVEYLYIEIIKPLSELGISLDVICVTGNHDHDDHGIKMFEPGREHLSWVFYNMLKLICKEAGMKHVTFDIPKGVFATTEIYGHRILYEHGTGVPANEKAMLNRLNQRIRQLREHITYFRMGDKHNICRFNEDTLVVNGAFFGNDTKGIEYSGICGYHACAGQIMFCYVPREDERLPIFDSFIIQLQHIN